jgi:peroxiredoxin Q/BCP
MRRTFLRCAAFLLVLPVATIADELKAGDKAPPFELTGTDGKTYRLEDFKGKSWVVLAWFPKADTPGCTAECKSFTARAADLKETKAAYFTASVDAVDANKAFVSKYGFNFPILSDPTKRVATAYGVIGPRGVAQRWTYYIDPEGTIRHIDKAVKAQEAAADVLAKLKELGATE